MKKTLFNNLKTTQLIVVTLLYSMALTSCLFDSDDNGLESWLSDRGLPNNYQVQTLSIDNIKPSSVEVNFDMRPKSADVNAVLGHVSNLTHDLVFDLAYSDTSFMKKMSKSDTAGAFLILSWLKPFYNAKQYPSDSLPFDDELEVTVSWKLETNNKDSYKSYFNKITKIADSTWYKELKEWKSDGSADTVVNMKRVKNDTTAAVRLDLPSALVKELKKVKGSAHLQLRLSAPNAPRLYRFYGDASTSYPPSLVLYSDSTTYMKPTPTPFRMANIVKNEEECPECAILHGGGVFDSLVVEIPSEPILEALSEFYGDEFPFIKGDSNDVRQTVIHAQITMARDDSKGSNELGLPIQIVAGSYVDSADMRYLDTADLRYRRMERYRLDTAVILSEGHQNLVFHEGDSLTLQLSYGFRDFLNKASDGRSLKFSMRIGWPFLQEKMTVYRDTIITKKTKVVSAKGDTTYKTKNDTLYKYFGYFDYARYDFSTAMENPMTVKLWLASKREDEK